MRARNDVHKESHLTSTTIYAIGIVSLSPSIAHAMSRHPSYFPLRKVPSTVRIGCRQVWKALMQDLKAQKTRKNVCSLDANLHRQLPWTHYLEWPLPISSQATTCKTSQSCPNSIAEVCFWPSSFLIAHIHCIQLAYVILNSLDNILY